jgi:hypothetical protein
MDTRSSSIPFHIHHASKSMLWGCFAALFFSGLFIQGPAFSSMLKPDEHVPFVRTLARSRDNCSPTHLSWHSLSGNRSTLAFEQYYTLHVSHCQRHCIDQPTLQPPPLATMCLLLQGSQATPGPCLAMCSRVAVEKVWQWLPHRRGMCGRCLATSSARQIVYIEAGKTLETHSKQL